jgi:hypothetical protein
MVQEMRYCETIESSSLQEMWTVRIIMPFNYNHVAYANDFIDVFRKWIIIVPGLRTASHIRLSHTSYDSSFMLSLACRFLRTICSYGSS